MVVYWNIKLNYKDGVDVDRNIIKEMLINADVESIMYVGKVIDVAEIYYELVDKGHNFFHEDDYCPDDIIDSLEDKDIIAICKNKYRDGEVEWFVQEIFNNYGEQLYDDSEIVIIDKELLDELNLDEFKNDIIAVSIDEESVEDSGCEDNELDDILEDMTEVLLEDLAGEELCPHCTIKNSLEDVWAIGYEQGYNDAVLEMKEKLNDMDDLLL